MQWRIGNFLSAFRVLIYACTVENILDVLRPFFPPSPASAAMKWQTESFDTKGTDTGEIGHKNERLQREDYVQNVIKKSRQKD